MGLEFCSFASGSSGNCYFVRNDDTALLVDTGIAGKHIKAGLKKCGAELSDVDWILLTHEHTDHVKSIRMMGRQAGNATVYGTKGTLERVRDRLPQDRTKVICRRERFEIGNIRVASFALSHDAADPVGYSFESGGRKVAIVTDTGCVTKEIFEEVEDSDALILEANHEVNILRAGPYPYYLKRRILGEHGHLSNEAAGDLLCRILERADGYRKPEIVLGHLSKENNTPAQAFLTVRNVLFEEDYFVNKNLGLTVAERDVPTPMIRVR